MTGAAMWSWQADRAAVRAGSAGPAWVPPAAPSGEIRPRPLGRGADGLVSVPTTQKRPIPSPRVSAEADAMRRERGGFVPPARASRVARMRRAIGFSARAHLIPRPGHRPERVVMVTATYRPGELWEPGHVAVWLDHVRKWCKRKGVACRYVWVAELQESRAARRGDDALAVVHYHVALWLPVDVRLPMSDACGWWPHGDTRTEVARAAVPYLMKYFSKGSQGLKLPGHCRMYGVGGLDHALRRARRWLGLPGFVQARADSLDDWKRATGGGWLTPEGFVVPGEFERVWLGDAYGLRRVDDYGRPFEAAGPFTWLHRRPQEVQ